MQTDEVQVAAVSALTLRNIIVRLGFDGVDVREFDCVLDEEVSCVISDSILVPFVAVHLDRILQND